MKLVIYFGGTQNSLGAGPKPCNKKTLQIN